MLEVKIECLIGQEGQLAPASDAGIRSDMNPSTRAPMTNEKCEMIYGKCALFPWQPLFWQVTS